MKINLAIVSPAFNEETQIPIWIREIDAMVKNHRDVFESVALVIVDDGSVDRTFDEILRCRSSLEAIQLKPVRLVKNFGHQAALICGLRETLELGIDFDVVVTMDSDGEHPGSVILEMLPFWREGHLIVHTVRNESAGLSPFKRFTSRLFYWIMKKSTGLPIQAGMADFKLWDFHLLKDVESYLPHIGSLRLFAVYLSPNSAKVTFDQKLIAGRVSRFSMKKMLSLGLQSLVFYSALPMRMIGLVGIVSVAFSLILLVHTLVVFMRGQTVPGWSSLMITVSFFSGANAFCLYFIAEYLLRMSFRSKLPTYVKRSRR